MLVSRRLIGEMFWVFTGTFVSMSVVLAGTRFLTTSVSPTEYGRLSLMISIAVLLDQVAGHAIGGAAMRFYPVYQAENRLSELCHIILRCWRITAVACVIAAAVVTVFRWPVIDTLSLLTIGFALGLLVSGIGVRLAEGARRRSVAAGFRSAFELVRFGLAVMFILVGTATAESAMAGFMMGALLVAGVHWYFVRFKLLGNAGQDGDRDVRRRMTRSFLNFAAPLMLVGFGSWGFLMSPLWVLGWFGDLSNVGTFSAYHQLAFVPMLVVSGLLLTFLAPIVYEKTLESIDKAMHGAYRLAAVTLFVVVFIALIAQLEHRELAAMLLGEKFRVDSWIFPWLIMAGGMYGVSQQLLLRLRVEMRIMTLATIQLGFAVIAAVFYSFAASSYAVEGVVYAVTALNALLLAFAAIYGTVLGRLSRAT